MHPRAPFWWPGRATVPAAHITGMKISRAARCSRLVLAPVLLVGTLLGTAGLAAPAAVAGPSGPSGSWTNTFDEEFNGTALDTSKWMPNWYGEGGVMNDVGTYAANVSEGGGHLTLTLAGPNSGALIGSDVPGGHKVAVGEYVEASVLFPGNGTSIDNWPAWWTSSPNWPAAGEHDIAEGLGSLTVNYHSPSGPHNQGTIPGNWSNAYHTYGVLRAADHADVYWDGQLVKSYPTDDNGQPEQLIFNVGGSGSTGGSQMLVDWVRAWSPGPGGAPAPAPVPATEMHGAIAEHYYDTPGLAALFGPTTTPERTTPDTVGRYNHFTGGDGGSIYWTPNTGAWSVHGAIRGHWESLGWETGPMGHPTTDENTTPDGVGRYNHFTGGDGASVYWTPSTGAWSVHGAIRDRWASMGWELSSLGYPVGDEHAVPGGRRSDFQHGSITYRFSDGAILVG